MALQNEKGKLIALTNIAVLLFYHVHCTGKFMIHSMAILKPYWTFVLWLIIFDSYEKFCSHSNICLVEWYATFYMTLWAPTPCQYPTQKRPELHTFIIHFLSSSWRTRSTHLHTTVDLVWLILVKKPSATKRKEIEPDSNCYGNHSKWC